MRPYFSEMDIETGKSSMCSAGKKRSIDFLPNVVGPPGVTSMMWSFGSPSAGLLAKAMSVDGALLPGRVTFAKAAACATSDCSCCLSTLKSCMLPCTRLGREGAAGAMPTTTSHFSSALIRSEMIWLPLRLAERLNSFFGAPSPSDIDHVYTAVAVTKPKVDGVSHFQNSTGSIGCDFIFVLSSKLKICMWSCVAPSVVTATLSAIT
mmetsp:Transcript_12126/g.39865  ORF Transcript_12126/g.39865 Transcript_12126/m.39865 type:complete len:207 (+) Transcript_12126:4368-4988(+)